MVKIIDGKGSGLFLCSLVLSIFRFVKVSSLVFALVPISGYALVQEFANWDMRTTSSTPEKVWGVCE